MQEKTENTDKNKWLAAAGWAVLAAALAVAFASTFAEMWMRWFPGWNRLNSGFYDQITKTESYYTHAPLVPLVSLLIGYLLIRYTRIPVRPRPLLGWLVLGGSILLHLTAAFARVNFASGFAFIGVLAGLTLVGWGSTAFRRLWFPIFFLFFMVPLPEVSIAQLNFRLKILAADWGVTMANWIGIIAERSSNRVFLEGDKSMVIANICNGLRTLISVMAFGALYAYICRLKGFWRIFLFAMSVPVAVVSNALRILSLIVVADLWTVDVATGWFHDFSGLMILVMSFLLLFGLERLILAAYALAGSPVPVTPLFADVRRTGSEPPQGTLLWNAIRTRNSQWALAAAILMAAGTWWFQRTIPPVYTEAILAGALPEQIRYQDEDWNSYIVEFDPQVLVVLETEAALMRRYARPGREPVDFCLVFSKDNRKGTHPPDLCLEGSGQNIIYKNTLAVTHIPDIGDVSCRELVVQSGSRQTYYLYTYKCGRRYTDSFWLQQAVIFANGLGNRNASGALIRVSTPVETGIPQARARAGEFLRSAMPQINRVLP